MTATSLDAAGRNALADALDESPWHVTAIHLLRRGLCTAYVEGNPSTFGAAVIHWEVHPHELMAFGADVDAILRLLQNLPDWHAVSIAAAEAPLLGAAIQRDFARRVRYHEEVHHTLVGPPTAHTHPTVRLLTGADVGLMEGAPPLLRQGRAFGGATGLLREGIIAGAVHEGGLVATAHTSVASKRYADIGVATLEPYRGQGISAAAASLVCREVQARGQTPVWSCDEDNRGSLRVAEKIGFNPIGRRISVILADV